MEISFISGSWIPNKCPPCDRLQRHVSASSVRRQRRHDVVSRQTSWCTRLYSRLDRLHLQSNYAFEWSWMCVVVMEECRCDVGVSLQRLSATCCWTFDWLRNSDITDLQPRPSDAFVQSPLRLQLYRPSGQVFKGLFHQCWCRCCAWTDLTIILIFD